uniref:Uncharacterized protein n=1 Tax=Nelumbo nucifera TaxID=4432 RepID=A0A822XKD6_NELNU|nr:TPA_asm: hypothetical protein HUJ06_023497 [Nelumbo nucifera]
MSRPKGVPLTQLNLAAPVQNIKSVYKTTESFLCREKGWVCTWENERTGEAAVGCGMFLG